MVGVIGQAWMTIFQVHSPLPRLTTILATTHTFPLLRFPATPLAMSETTGNTVIDDAVNTESFPNNEGAPAPVEVGNGAGPKPCKQCPPPTEEPRQTRSGNKTTHPGTIAQPAPKRTSAPVQADRERAESMVKAAADEEQRKIDLVACLQAQVGDEDCALFEDLLLKHQDSAEARKSKYCYAYTCSFVELTVTYM
jgi:hypothetical protein